MGSETEPKKAKRDFDCEDFNSLCVSIGPDDRMSILALGIEGQASLAMTCVQAREFARWIIEHATDAAQ